MQYCTYDLVAFFIYDLVALMRQIFVEKVYTFLKPIILTVFLQVVDLLLARRANKEHRNISVYTPFSLAASGGFVSIIKLLLRYGAEINSR